jgi:uncharacterized membrane protein YoaK (UPF0700 family)
MSPETRVRNISLLLTFVAGYCDTVTFIAADEVFSAHVTGNFIVLAYDLVNRTGSGAWAKLLTFPVFVIAVMVGGWIASKWAKEYLLLLLEGGLLLLSGSLAFLLLTLNISSFVSMYSVTLMIVFAMGLQNAFSRLYSKQTFGPTTVMTGTVTQAALDVSASLSNRFTDITKAESLKKQSVMIIGFLLGCLLGAVAAKLIGLSVVALPGLLLTILYAGAIVGTFTRSSSLQP